MFRIFLDDQPHFFQLEQHASRRTRHENVLRTDAQRRAEKISVVDKQGYFVDNLFKSPLKQAYRPLHEATEMSSPNGMVKGNRLRIILGTFCYLLL